MNLGVSGSHNSEEFARCKQQTVIDPALAVIVRPPTSLSRGMQYELCPRRLESNGWCGAFCAVGGRNVQFMHSDLPRLHASARPRAWSVKAAPLEVPPELSQNEKGAGGTLSARR